MLAAIALGSNLGDSRSILDGAIQALDRGAALRVVQVSRWYRTRAITLPHSAPQPDYLNGCALLQTRYTPQALLAELLQVELFFGRQRRQLWDARTLDLDLLLYEHMVLDSKTLTIPHPRMADRAFVLLPLAEIAPHWVHPIRHQTIAELAIAPADLDQCQPLPLDAQSPWPMVGSSHELQSPHYGHPSSFGS